MSLTNILYILSFAFYTCTLLFVSLYHNSVWEKFLEEALSWQKKQLDAFSKQTKNGHEFDHFNANKIQITTPPSSLTAEYPYKSQLQPLESIERILRVYHKIISPCTRQKWESIKPFNNNTSGR